MKEIKLLVNDDVEVLGITCYTKDGNDLLVADDGFSVCAENGAVHNLCVKEELC